MDFKCTKCKSERYILKEKGNSMVGVYCADCGKWQRWLSKEEMQQVKVEEAKSSMDLPCDFCSSEYVIATAWGDEGIIGWITIQGNFCPSCGRPLRKIEEV